MSSARRHLSVLITRPSGPAERLAARIEALGMTAIIAPMLAIERFDSPDLHQRLAQLPAQHIIVFVSRHAASYGIECIHRAGLSIAGKQLFAVGPATAAVLNTLGYDDVGVPPTDFSSAGLLAMAALEGARIDGHRVLIVRGRGGRETLADGLRARGATVNYLEVYRRLPATPRLPEILSRANVEQPDIAVVSSVEGLRALASTIERQGLPDLFRIPILAGAARIADEVAKLGFTNPPVIADNPDDESITRTLRRWATTQI